MYNLITNRKQYYSYMTYICKIIATLVAVTSLSVIPGYAQTKEFKSQWTQVEDQLYFKSAVSKDRMPSGDTEIRLFGFRDKQPLEAPVEISGNVVKAEKGDKQYDYTIDSAVVEINGYDNDANNILKYEGNMVLHIALYKKDEITLIMSPVTGNFKISSDHGETFTNYHIKEGWGPVAGALKVASPKPEKNTVPEINVIFTYLNLPKHSTESVTPTIEILNQLKNGQLPLYDADRAFLHMFLTDDEHLEDVPGLQVDMSTIYRTADGTKYDSEVLGYRLGDEVELSQTKVKRKADTYTISHRGTLPMYTFTATYRNSAYPKFTNVKWDDGSVFSDDILKRSDGSQITMIKFDVDSTLPDGYVTLQALALGKFTDLDFYDFNKYIGELNLKVGAYHSPDMEPELIEEDNIIKSVRDRVEAEREAIRSEVRQRQAIYDNADSWLKARQTSLQADLPEYSGGKEVFTLANNQAARPHDMKVTRYVRHNDSDNEYYEQYYVSDSEGTFPLSVDSDGDFCYTTPRRTYYITRINDKARPYLDNYLLTITNKKVVEAGRPVMPTFE